MLFYKNLNYLKSKHEQLPVFPTICYENYLHYKYPKEYFSPIIVILKLQK